MEEDKDLELKEMKKDKNFRTFYIWWMIAVVLWMIAVVCFLFLRIGTDIKKTIRFNEAMEQASERASERASEHEKTMEKLRQEFREKWGEEPTF